MIRVLRTLRRDRHHGRPVVLWIGPLISLLVGCGTTRMSDSKRTATEQLLVSQAIDRAVMKIDVRALAGRKVFLETAFMDDVEDGKYLDRPSPGTSSTNATPRRSPPGRRRIPQLSREPWISRSRSCFPPRHREVKRHLVRSPPSPTSDLSNCRTCVETGLERRRLAPHGPTRLVARSDGSFEESPGSRCTQGAPGD